jgi:hypothetical protein
MDILISLGTDTTEDGEATTFTIRTTSPRSS